MERRLALWVPAVLDMAAIFYVSSLHQAPLPPGVGDKPAHSLAYVILGVLVVRAVAGGLPSRLTWTTALLALAITIGYGASDELHQRFVPGRSADLMDLYADAVGACIGTIACWAWGIISPGPEQIRRAAPRHDL